MVAATLLTLIASVVFKLRRWLAVGRAAHWTSRSRNGSVRSGDQGSRTCVLVPAANVVGLTCVFPFKSKNAKAASKASSDAFGMAVQEPGDPTYMVAGFTGRGAA